MGVYNMVQIGVGAPKVHYCRYFLYQIGCMCSIGMTADYLVVGIKHEFYHTFGCIHSEGFAV